MWAWDENGRQGRIAGLSLGWETFANAHLAACGRRCYRRPALGQRDRGGLRGLRSGLRPERLRGGPQPCLSLAEHGDARAQFSLGGMYYNGQGVQQDYAEAAKWTRKAAEQGYTPAQADLGVLYWNGQGVQQDVVLAYMWLSLAAAHEPDAVRERDLAASQMTTDEIAEAQRLARDWKPTTPSP
jgi:TPR repeat protein